jgi:outer membrane lipoprotein-sorting protein
MNTTTGYASKVRLILGLFVFSATAPLPFATPAAEGPIAPASSSLDDVSRALAQAKTVFSHFVQERHLSLFKEPLRSEGYLCFQQPGRIRWEVTAPYKSILVSDGSGVAQFEWLDEQWKKLDIGLAAAMQNVVSQIAAVMQGSYARGGREYQVTLTQTERGAVVSLVPANEKMRKMIKAIEVHLAGDLKATRRVVLREQTGDYTDIQFDQQVVNVSFREGTFDRKAPLALDAVREVMTQTTR